MPHFNNQNDVMAWAARRAAEWDVATRKSADDSTRRVRESLVRSALQRAVAQAPDAFRGVSVDAMTRAVMSLLD
jgi:hypothetical protein